MMDVPLLFESGLDRTVDVVVVVKASRNAQIIRAAKRLNISRIEALRRIKAQQPLNQKIRLADYVIDNGAGKLKTKQQVKEIWQKLNRKKNR